MLCVHLKKNVLAGGSPAPNVNLPCSLQLEQDVNKFIWTLHAESVTVSIGILLFCSVS